jgi:predicted nucleotidyltransferase component of viral defense system
MPPATQDIKKLVILAIASDDELMEQLVLKGGHAIELVQRRGNKLSRISNDFDFSMEGSFDDDLARVKVRLERTITDTFAEHGLVVFDYDFAIRPSEVSESVKDIWGGYQLSFKVTSPENQAKASGNMDKLRREALPVQSNGSTRIEVDISKFEYVGRKQEFAVDGFRIYIYSPEMIVFEKLRAICQQNPHYADIIPGYRPRARARDFYDIPMLVDQFKIDPWAPENKMLIEVIFEAKRVPLSYIREIGNHLDIHRGDWQSLLDTLPALEREEVREFDYYARYITALFEPLTFP